MIPVLINTLKGVTAEIEYFDPSDPPESLLELNPNGTSPTLVERELVLYDSRIIMEYQLQNS
jgi:RNA polymerase-associated protein